MTFPVVEGVVTGKNDSQTLDEHVITFPPSIQPGEILLVIFSTENDQTTQVSSGSGWNKLFEEGNGSTDGVTLAVYWKIATGSGDNLTIHTSDTLSSNWVTYRISGAINVQGSLAEATSGDANPPNHSRTVTRDYLWIAAGGVANGGTATSAPAGYTNFQAIDGITNGCSTFSAQRNITASSENPGTFNTPSDRWVAVTLSLTPAAQADGSVLAHASLGASANIGKGASAHLKDDQSFLTSKRSRAKNTSPTLSGEADFSVFGFRGKPAIAALSGAAAVADVSASRARGRFWVVTASATFTGGVPKKHYGGVLVGRMTTQFTARPAEKALLRGFGYILPPILEFHRHRTCSVSATASLTLVTSLLVSAISVELANASLACSAQVSVGADVSAAAVFSGIANRHAPVSASVTVLAVFQSGASRGVHAEAAVVASGIVADVDFLAARGATGQLSGVATAAFAKPVRLITTRFAKTKGIGAIQGTAERHRSARPLMLGRGIARAIPSSSRAASAAGFATGKLTAIKRAAIRGALSGLSGAGQISGKTFIKLNVPASLQAGGFVDVIPTPTHPGDAAVVAGSLVTAQAASKRGAKAFVTAFVGFDPTANARRRTKIALFAGSQLTAQRHMIEAALTRILRGTALIGTSARANRIRSAQLHGHRSKVVGDADLIGGRDAAFLAQCFVGSQAVAVRSTATAVSCDAEVAALASLGVNAFSDVSGSALSGADAVALRRSGIFLFGGVGNLQASGVRAGTLKLTMSAQAILQLAADVRHPSSASAPAISSCEAIPNLMVSSISQLSGFAALFSSRSTIRGRSTHFASGADIEVGPNSVRAVEASLIAKCAIDAGWGGEIANVKFDVV